jgi:hypothetical protein
MARYDELSDGYAFEEGKEYRFTITCIGEPVSTTNSHYRTWNFKTLIDGNSEDININLFPFQAMPICELFGFVKEKGKMKVDYDKIENKSILATVFYEKYKKKDGSEGKSPKLKDFKACEQEEEIGF